MESILNDWLKGLRKRVFGDGELKYGVFTYYGTAISLIVLFLLF